ncbi:hypothetical protein BAUCODRAFT_65596 [Baudoinia panamericana UAMH 10762]|uniref:D-isomer specific 2-hydroxyacid dehydrogenase NAD-binding domain-containing protein n=1 Tax=Baudoinia panamericana (strain UAMH 10762) TaxID=717646 RepID=M2N3Q9_BAUPA|nr:uncharacterized protein BAUCODRAFT_65596 [Baudoinia panamericana UAMH 10762]EMC98613.1 hypothetical protein BAUCODRAFT_65596 [Baudoinia panamericana UAMH 10762]
MASTTKARLAIIDDYFGLAQQHFDRINGIQIDTYSETLDPLTSSGLDALVKRLEPYQIISSMRERTPFPAELLKRLPNLKLLLNASGRNNSIDMQCASSQGIIVTGTKGDRPTDSQALQALPDLPPPKGHSSVVQHTWAMLLALCSRLAEDDRTLKTQAKIWQTGLMVPIAGKVLGIVGLGKLGIGVAKIGVLAWGMDVVAWSENLTEEKADAAAESAGLPKGSFKSVTKEELFQRSDVVSLHNVLSARSKGIVGVQELSWMKKSAILVNTSRGPLIDEQALIAALKEGGIGGAALDVFWEEPLSPDSQWRSVDEWAKSGVLLSPHMGYVNAGTMHRWYQEQAENVKRWLKGEEVSNRMN